VSEVPKRKRVLAWLGQHHGARPSSDQNNPSGEIRGSTVSDTSLPLIVRIRMNQRASEAQPVSYSSVSKFDGHVVFFSMTAVNERRSVSISPVSVRKTPVPLVRVANLTDGVERQLAHSR
jgi:hypothetical protein